jgi:hypothetical protein
MAFDFVFGNAQSVREVCAGTYKTETALQAVVIAAIAAVVATGELFTCTASCSGYSQQDIQNVVRILVDQGYMTSYSGTTLTISW